MDDTDSEPGTPAGGRDANDAAGEEALEISPEELAAALDGTGPTPRLIDVRPRGAYARGHLPGSENVPLGELPSRADEFEGADRVVCVCREGIASLQAVRLLTAYEGVDRVESLAGGIEAWSGDLVTGSESEGRKRSDGGEAPF